MELYNPIQRDIFFENMDNIGDHKRFFVSAALIFLLFWSPFRGTEHLNDSSITEKSEFYNSSVAGVKSGIKSGVKSVGKPIVNAEKEIFSVEVWITAYSSTPEETDDTPFITASGSEVREGIVAANFLPFSAKIKIPEIFGDKIFIVEDRMHKRKTDFVDIWMPSKEKAKNFGIRRAKILVIEFPDYPSEVLVRSL